MIWTGSIVAGNGEKLSDETFRLLSDHGEGVGWMALQAATFFVHKNEWEAIAYLLAVSYGLEDCEQEEWTSNVSQRYKQSVLQRYLRDLTEAARAIKNEYDAMRVLDRFLIMPMGLHVRPEILEETNNQEYLLVVR